MTLSPSAHLMAATEQSSVTEMFDCIFIAFNRVHFNIIRQCSAFDRHGTCSASDVVKYGVVLPITGFFIAPFQDYYGDEKEDNFAIKIGYEYYRNNDFCGIIRKQAANLKHGKTDCEPRHEVGTPPGIERIITW